MNMDARYLNGRKKNNKFSSFSLCFYLFFNFIFSSFRCDSLFLNKFSTENFNLIFLFTVSKSVIFFRKRFYRAGMSVYGMYICV